MANLDINCLPDDLLVEIIARVASSSSTPARDIISIRQSCKRLNKASKARMVGQCFSVDKEWMFHWRDKEGYFSLIRSCAKSGNVQANCILGLELIYNKKDIKAGLRYLKRAVAGGHYVAGYAIGVLYFRDHVMRHYGIELLNELSNASGKQQIMMSRKEVVSVLRKITMERWPLEQSSSCTNPSCGRVESMGHMNECWDVEEMVGTFCSHLCKWTHECKMFLERYNVESSKYQSFEETIQYELSVCVYISMID